VAFDDLTSRKPHIGLPHGFFHGKHN
jgi:hypothetical protein